MEAEQIIKYIQTSKKKTPVKLYIKCDKEIVFPNTKRFGDVIIGDWEDIEPVLRSHLLTVEDYFIETTARNSAVPLHKKYQSPHRTGSHYPGSCYDRRQRGDHDGSDH